MLAENAYIFRTIDIYLQTVWANPRFISSNQGKNAMLYVLHFSIGKFLLNLKMNKSKKSSNGVCKLVFNFTDKTVPNFKSEHD